MAWSLAKEDVKAEIKCRDFPLSTLVKYD